MNSKNLWLFLVIFLSLATSYSVKAQDSVDASTLTGKYMCGYQGWFQAPGDGSGGGWFHWFNGSSPVHASLNTDVFPDLTEYPPAELFPTLMHYSDGSVVKLYSSYKEATVARHFKWMKDNNIDGVWVQRFGPRHTGWNDFTNRVLLNCKKGAETYGRVYTVMYDVSGANNSTLFSDITRDWMYLVDTFKVTESPRYCRHNGKPVVSVWGFGFSDRSITAAVAAQIVKWFKTDAAAKYQATFMGGVNDNWRTIGTPWDSVCRSVDIISPWMVGRFSGVGGADNWKNNIVADIAEAKKIGKDYLPVIWPGFSWSNMHHGSTPQNQIPRLGGAFFWEQAYNCISAGATMLYNAMFDEVDEGTAILKACPKKALAPSDGWWLTLDADGYNNLPSDWYLRLAGYANKMLNKQIPLSKTMPIDPNNPPISSTLKDERGTSDPAAGERIRLNGGTLELSLGVAEKATVTLYKMDGKKQKVFECRSAGGTTRVPMFTQGNIPGGTYLVRLKGENGIVENKILAITR
jgi:hypothetical protein